MGANRDEYNVLVWENEATKLNAYNLNHIEDGIMIAMNLAKENAIRLDEVRVAFIENIYASHDSSSETFTISFGNNETLEYKKTYSFMLDTHTSEINQFTQNFSDLRNGLFVVDKATKDASGNNIENTYETKTDAVSKLEESKAFTQEEVLIEKNRASLSEQTINNRITSVNQSLSNDISSETSRAEEAESDLADSISLETTRASNVEKDLDDKIDSETSRAEEAENTIQSNIESERARAELAENTLDDKIDDEVTAITNEISSLKNVKVNYTDIVDNLTTSNSNKPLSAKQGYVLKGLIDTINGILQSDDVSLDTLQELVAYVKNNKDLIDSITVDKVNVSDIIDNLTSEITDQPLSANQGYVLKGLHDALVAVVNTKANDADVYHKDAIDAKENALEALVATEEDRALEAESDLADDIDGLEASKVDKTTYATDKTNIEQAIDDEETRAKAAESTLDGKITSETSRATTKEGELTSAISNEVTRASDAESTLDGKITAEKNRAEGVEATLSGRITTEVSDRQSADNALDQAKINYTDVVDSLTDTGTNVPLSANQGRILKGLIDTINSVLASDDVNLDTVQEIITYIKNNNDLIDNITTNKVNVSDIIDNLTTQLANKPLSANQGYVLKGLHDALVAVVNTKAAASNVYTKAESDTRKAATEALISAEETRATAAESDLDDKIDQEIEDREDADDALSAAITAEETRAKGVEDDLDDKIDQEISDRQAADQGLADDITAEETRATTEEAKKINYTDIVDNLTTNNANKPLSAKQGKVLKGLIDSINTLLASNDTDLDTLQEVVTFIKNNKDLIDGITTNKVSVSDIVDNLTSEATNKPLSAKQGKVLKGLIDSLTTTVGTKANSSDVYVKTYIDTLETILRGLITAEETRATGVESGKQNTIDSSHKLDADLVDDSEALNKFVSASEKQDIANNKTARHTHSNKALLDTYSQTNANLADAVSKKHSHSNKSILDAVEQAFTTALKNKLDGIESGAQANIIEEIKLNGTKINPVEKSVAIDLSSYALKTYSDLSAHDILITPAAGHVYNFQLKDKNGNLIGSQQTIDLDLESFIVNGYYNDEDKEIVLVLDSGSEINIPVDDLIDGLVYQTDLNTLIAGYYTSAQTDTELAKKQNNITSSNMLGADLVDDSESTHKFVTASDKNAIASNTAARHSHTNKALLDTYDQLNSDISDAVSKKHTHSNKALLDTYTQTNANISDAISKRHTHSNKALLDTYTQTESDLADAVSQMHTHTSSLSNIEDAVSKKHSHSNKAILDGTEESFTTTLKDKLDGIATGAEVNVQSDWNATEGDAFIKNKPSLGTASSKNTGTSSGNVPVLDSNGKLPESVIPAVALNDSFEVSSQAAMLALTAQHGDIAIRTDINKTFILGGTNDPSVLANWKELRTPTDAVSSVNGATGAVSIGDTTGLKYLTTAPTSNNTNGLKIVVLTSNPTTKYSGYIYIIKSA